MRTKDPQRRKEDQNGRRFEARVPVSLQTTSVRRWKLRRQETSSRLACHPTLAATLVRDALLNIQKKSLQKKSQISPTLRPVRVSHVRIRVMSINKLHHRVTRIGVAHNGRWCAGGVAHSRGGQGFLAPVETSGNGGSTNLEDAQRILRTDMNRDLLEEFLDHCDEIFCVSSRPSPQVIRPRTKLLEHGFARKLKTSLSDDWDHVGIQALCLEELQGKVDILEATVGAHH